MQPRMFEVSDERKINPLNPFPVFASIKLGPFNKPAIQAKTKILYKLLPAHSSVYDRKKG